jgi:hypothetical protein
MYGRLTIYDSLNCCEADYYEQPPNLYTKPDSSSLRISNEMKKVARDIGIVSDAELVTLRISGSHIPPERTNENLPARPPRGVTGSRFVLVECRYC